MFLSALIKQVYVPSRISLSKRYISQLGESTSAYGLHLGRRATTKDFVELSIAKFLSSLADDHPATTINTYRARLLSLWEGAKEANLIDRSPDRKLVRRLREELDPPEAWDDDQVNLLILETARQPGEVCGVPAGEWWLSLTLAIYYTSCRISSVLSVPPGHYDGIGILVRKQKNHRPQWFRLPPELCQMIEQIQRGKRQRIWAHPWHPQTVWAKFRRIVESAGLPAPKTGKQLLYRLRRTIVRQAIREWGAKAGRLIKQNPYLLRRFPGAGFALCNRLYIDLGHNPAKLKRQAACIEHIISRDRDGHTWFRPQFIESGLQTKIGGCSVRAIDAARLAKRAGRISIIHYDNGRVWIAAPGRHLRRDRCRQCR